jgi:hypothetical protein
MKSINFGRVLLGAVISAVVLFVASGIVNGAILGDEWKHWQESLGALNHAPSPGTGMVIWTIVSLVYGLAGMWIYAGIRPRYGAGPMTAAIAGLILWLAGGLTGFLGHVALDDIPMHIALVNCVAYLICDPLAIIAGAFAYKE